MEKDIRNIQNTQEQPVVQEAGEKAIHLQKKHSFSGWLYWWNISMWKGHL